MKISPEQKLMLQKYLRKGLKFRETYAEFYDHIVSALEKIPGDILFEDAVKKVINEDFGGAKEMVLTEDKYKDTIFKELKKKYLGYAADNFMFTGIFVTAAFVALFYFMVKQQWFGFDMFLLNMFAIRVIPDVLGGIIYLTSPPRNGAPKRSVKNIFYKWQNAIAAFILIAAFWFALSGPFKYLPWVKNITPLAMIILLVLISLHSLTYYKVRRDDIKTVFKLS